MRRRCMPDRGARLPDPAKKKRCAQAPVGDASGALPEFIDSLNHRAYVLPEGTPSMMATSFLP